MSSRWASRRGMLGVTVAWVALDQWSKCVVRQQMPLGESIPLVRHVFHLTHVRNTGAAFGLLPGGQWLFVLIAVGVCALLLVRGRRWIAGSAMLTVAYGLVMGGAIGNLIDRLRFGYVTDFFDLRVWPVFNVADTGLTIGVALLALHLMWSPSNEGTDGVSETPAG